MTLVKNKYKSDKSFMIYLYRYLHYSIKTYPHGI